MGLRYPNYLTGDKIYKCRTCGCHLARSDDLMSKNFQSHSGKAYLYSHVVNITMGESEDRYLRTGLHTVADIACQRCSTNVGWTYIYAYESDQKFKEGKYVLEKARMKKSLFEYDSETLTLVIPAPQCRAQSRKSATSVEEKDQIHHFSVMHSRGFVVAVGQDT